MTKEEILYNVGLTEKVYSDQKDIDFKSLGLKLVKWVEDKKSDTQGFVAIKDKSIYIVWRGSSSKKDFQNDASIDKVPFIEEGEKVHIGFKSSWEAVKDQTYEALDKALKTLGGENKIDNIIVCGHSLGAAVTTLFATEFGIDPALSNENLISSPRCKNLPPIYKLLLLLSNASVVHGPFNPSPTDVADDIFDHLFVFKFQAAK
jgi:uncharacterized alpha/beta hydrolase family protein